MAEIDSTRGRQLQQLAQSLPGANQKIQQGQQAARQMQLQETIKQMQPAQATSQAAQQIGASMAQQQGQSQLQGMQQQQNQQVQLGQLGLQQKAGAQREAEATRQLQLNKQQIAIGNAMNRINKDLKNKLLDQQMSFKRDEAGRTLFNERQLLDWAATNARNEEEFRNYQMEAGKQQERKMQLLARVNQVSKQALEQGFIARNKPLDQQHRLLLAQMANGSEEAAAKLKAKAANTQAMWQAGGTIIGSIWGPAGAAIGGAIGSVLGNMFS